MKTDEMKKREKACCRCAQEENGSWRRYVQRRNGQRRDIQRGRGQSWPVQNQPVQSWPVQNRPFQGKPVQRRRLQSCPGQTGKVPDRIFPPSGRTQKKRRQPGNGKKHQQGGGHHIHWQQAAGGYGKCGQRRWQRRKGAAVPPAQGPGTRPDCGRNIPVSFADCVWCALLHRKTLSCGNHLCGRKRSLYQRGNYTNGDLRAAGGQLPLPLPEI